MCYVSSEDVKLLSLTYNKNKPRLFSNLVISAENARNYFAIREKTATFKHLNSINRVVIMHAMRRVLPSSFCSLEIEGPPPGELR
jgi:hypothetical protein